MTIFRLPAIFINLRCKVQNQSVVVTKLILEFLSGWYNVKFPGTDRRCACALGNEASGQNQTMGAGIFILSIYPFTTSIPTFTYQISVGFTAF
jgi:hypothetical protein